MGASHFVSLDLFISFLWCLKPQYSSRLFVSKGNQNALSPLTGVYTVVLVSILRGLFYGFVGFLVSKYACVSWNPLRFPEWLRRREGLFDQILP